MANPSVYMAASGGMAQYERLEHLSNNLANIDTTGFKAARPIFSAERPNYASQLRLAPVPGSDNANRGLSYARLSEVGIDLQQGGVEATGNPLDVAIAGEGWLAVKGPKGTVFTRAGAMAVNNEGILTTKDGLPMMGDGGPIQLSGPIKSIDPDGTVNSFDGPVGRLKVVEFDDTVQLRRIGMALFEALGPGGQSVEGKSMDNHQLLQGSLETSNVNPVSAMVELISAQRAFEQFQKTMQNLDNLEKQAVQQMARPR